MTALYALAVPLAIIIGIAVGLLISHRAKRPRAQSIVFSTSPHRAGFVLEAIC